MPVDDDYADETPLCTEEKFSELVQGMVADEAPRLFAVVQVYRERVDGRIAAWGIAFDDHVEVMSVEGRTHMRMRSPERAVQRFARLPDVSGRLVWVVPQQDNGASAGPDTAQAA